MEEVDKLTLLEYSCYVDDFDWNSREVWNSGVSSDEGFIMWERFYGDTTEI